VAYFVVLFQNLPSGTESAKILCWNSRSPDRYSKGDCDGEVLTATPRRSAFVGNGASCEGTEKNHEHRGDSQTL